MSSRRIGRGEARKSQRTEVVFARGHAGELREKSVQAEEMAQGFRDLKTRLVVV